MRYKATAPVGDIWNQKQGKSVASRVVIEKTGTKFEYEDYFAYVTADAPLEEMITQAMRVGLTDNQICTALNISKELYKETVNKSFSNAGHLKFLVSILPIEINTYDEMNSFWDKYKVNVNGYIEQGLDEEEISKRLNLPIERVYSYIKFELKSTSVVERGNQEVVSTTTEVVEIFKNVGMSEYSTLFGFSGLSFDYAKIDEAIRKDIPTLGFEKFIQKYNYSGIQDIIYVRTQLLGVFQESRPFYPAEDIILEKMYSKVGIRVVEIMSEVIPNYVVREQSEYADRIKLLKRGRVHPKYSWGISKIDEKIIRLLSSKKIALNNKYIPWLTTQEVQYYGYKLGYITKELYREFEEIDIENMDITPYIELASKYREVKYHSEKWNTERHEYFREQYREIGIEVAKEVTWASRSECLIRAKQFSIKQRYTEEDNDRIAEIFSMEGIEGVKRAYPNRTETALRYKIDQLGLKEQEGIVTENQIEELKAQMYKEWEEEERERIRKEERLLISKELERELAPKIEEKVKKNVEYTLRKELSPQLREQEIKRVHKEVESYIDEALSGTVGLAIATAVNKTPPKHYTTSLVAEIYDTLARNIKQEVANL